MTARTPVLPQADPHMLVARMLRRTVRDEDGCWIFTGSVTSAGYGQVGSGKGALPILTHRLMVIARDGSIPEGMTVDHTCHRSHECRDGDRCKHRRCVNPQHLAVVTQQQNIARQWEAGLCRKGHKFRESGAKQRRCPTCSREYQRRWLAKQQVA